MRKQEQEITDREEIQSIIRDSLVCRLGLCDGDRPYIVPMSFGYDGKYLFFHCAREGRKLDIIRQNPNVCFEFEADVALLPADNPCRTGLKYRSIIGFGTACILNADEERIYGLDLITRQYLGEVSEYSQNMLNNIEVIRVDIENMTGKRSG
ncbi:MAG: pyridoxamine 5'-phosphate oxidase family protein [Armatimonadota bacterium]